MKRLVRPVFNILILRFPILLPFKVSVRNSSNVMQIQTSMILAIYTVPKQ